MENKRVLKAARRLSEPYRVDDGGKFRLRDYDPEDTGDLKLDDRDRAGELLRTGVSALAELQDKLYAQNRWAVLLMFQAMDAAGKDGVIKHVLSGVNPQGCQVSSFGVPSEEELDHDFLWRCHARVPERGRIGIWNRSYYEEVLVVRVHPELLARQRLPKRFVSDRIWRQRFQDMRAFERYLARNGVAIRKFFLHVSRKEQKKRFLARIDDPAKNWKFSMGDVRERGHWKEYMAAYEELIRRTATPEAPWYVVPADAKWYTRLVVAGAVIDLLDGLHLEYPQTDPAQVKELAAARRSLLAER